MCESDSVEVGGERLVIFLVSRFMRLINGLLFLYFGVGIVAD